MDMSGAGGFVRPLNPSEQWRTLDRGQGVAYLLSLYADWLTARAAIELAKAQPASLAELEGRVCMWDLFAELENCGDLFPAAMASGNAGLVGVMLIEVRRGIAMRAHATLTAPTGTRPVFDPLLTSPGIAAQVYAAALPSLLNKGFKS